MALMNCPECEGKVSDKAKSCPHCGFPIEEFVAGSKLKEEFVIEKAEEIEVKCPYCDALIQKDDEYCEECGMRLIAYNQVTVVDTEKPGISKYHCLKCNELLPENENMCPRCGEEIPKQGKLKIDMLYCPTCHGYNVLGSSHCVHCGRRYSLNDLAICIEKAERDIKSIVIENSDKNLVKCKKCGSTSITYVNKRLSIGRALAGGFIASGPGAILGGLSSKKGKAKCLKCGHEWNI